MSQSTSELPIFEEQLLDELKLVTETYGEENHGFIYDVYHGDTAIIQVVHRSFIEKLATKNNDFGLSIYLTFDPTFPKNKEIQKKFQNSTHFKEFIYCPMDGIPCYALNLTLDYSKTARILTDILVEIYGFDQTTQLSTGFHDQGPVKL